MRSRKNKKFIFGIAVAMVLPLSLFFIMRSLSDGQLNIPPYYRIDNIYSHQVDGKEVTDTVYHQIRDLELTNQLGQKVNLNEDLKGKILVMDFIFTTCNSTCPRITANMSDLQKSFIKKNPDLVQFISVTVDPGRDSVAALRNYADRFNADHDRWWFLTGDQEEIFRFAREELGLKLQPADANPGQFDHSEKFVLIDSRRYIRGYFDGTDPAEMPKIADAIIVLSIEKHN